MGLDNSWTEFDLALDLFRRRQYQGAITAFERVLHYAQQINDLKTIIYTYLAIGDNNFYLGNYDQALDYFNETYSLAEQYNDENLIALSCLKLARSSVQFLSFEEVLRDSKIHNYLINALQLFESIEDDLGLMVTHGVLGFLERLIGHEEAAFFHFRTASHKALLLKKPDLMSFYRKRATDKASFLYNYYFSFQKNFPVTCPSCRQPVNPMITTCPFCEFDFYNLSHSV